MSLDLARVAVDQGISHALLTPHHMDGEYVNHKQDVIEKTNEFQKKLDSNQISLTVFAGQEVHLTGELISAIVETADMIFDLTTRGIVPVIAHPERNLGFQEKPDKLYEFVKMGCLTQLTSSSYLGVFGKHVQELTEQIIKANLGFVFASDAHNFKGRRYLMKEAFDKLEREEGRNKAQQFNINAKNIINGDDVGDTDYVRISELTKKRKRFWLF